MVQLASLHVKHWNPSDWSEEHYLEKSAYKAPTDFPKVVEVVVVVVVVVVVEDEIHSYPIPRYSGHSRIERDMMNSRLASCWTRAKQNACVAISVWMAASPEIRHSRQVEAAFEGDAAGSGHG